MKTSKIITISSKLFVALSGLSLIYVSLLSLINPQATMDLVHVNLSNTDAISSIRGIYGGAGIAITTSFLWVFFQQPRWSLTFLALFWGGYALSRILTIIIDGSLGEFGNQWLVIETIFCCIAILLALLYPQKETYFN